eukprot:7380639-Prymnesium_polylepis.3
MQFPDRRHGPVTAIGAGGIGMDGGAIGGAGGFGGSLGGMGGIGCGGEGDGGGGGPVPQPTVTCAIAASPRKLLPREYSKWNDAEWRATPAECQLSPWSPLMDHRTDPIASTTRSSPIPEPMSEVMDADGAHAEPSYANVKMSPWAR